MKGEWLNFTGGVCRIFSSKYQLLKRIRMNREASLKGLLRYFKVNIFNQDSLVCKKKVAEKVNGSFFINQLDIANDFDSFGKNLATTNINHKYCLVELMLALRYIPTSIRLCLLKFPKIPFVERVGITLLFCSANRILHLVSKGKLIISREKSALGLALKIVRDEKFQNIKLIGAQHGNFFEDHVSFDLDEYICFQEEYAQIVRQLGNIASLDNQFFYEWRPRFRPGGNRVYIAINSSYLCDFEAYLQHLLSLRGQYDTICLHPADTKLEKAMTLAGIDTVRGLQNIQDYLGKILYDYSTAGSICVFPNAHLVRCRPENSPIMEKVEIIRLLQKESIKNA